MAPTPEERLAAARAKLYAAIAAHDRARREDNREKTAFSAERRRRSLIAMIGAANRIDDLLRVGRF
jgi:hypothetical protein